MHINQHLLMQHSHFLHCLQYTLKRKRRQHEARRVLAKETHDTVTHALSAATLRHYVYKISSSRFIHYIEPLHLIWQQSWVVTCINIWLASGHSVCTSFIMTLISLIYGVELRKSGICV